MKEGREIDKICCYDMKWASRKLIVLKNEICGIRVCVVGLFCCIVDDVQPANSYFDGSGDVVLVIKPFLGMSRARRLLFKRHRD